MTVSSNVEHQAQVTSNNPNVNLDSDVAQEATRPQEPKTRPTAEDLHVMREPNWSSPAKSPCASQRDAADSDEGEAQEQVTRRRGNRTSKDGKRTSKGPTGKSSRPTPITSEDESTHEDALNIPTSTHNQNKGASQSKTVATNTAKSHIQPIGDTDAGVGLALPTDSTAAPRKRKVQDEAVSSESETPAPKKNKKGATASALKTPARTKLSKNFETPLPASPLHAARVTRFKPNLLQGASSSSAPLDTTKSAPAPTLSKTEARKAAALKAAATRAANKKAKEEQAKAKAQNESNTRKARK
ncbi:unnamed protein product [Rhizoctonia solani]|uniref:Uncharacterized protein n=1 Tax=Rhizoctonia solani TaxID=456999 RepID=A0A8H3ECV9_9AGAM|nr:unnamed protein product [Rhizoctonia solani]